MRAAPALLPLSSSWTLCDLVSMTLTRTHFLRSSRRLTLPRHRCRRFCTGRRIPVLKRGKYRAVKARSHGATATNTLINRHVTLSDIKSLSLWYHVNIAIDILHVTSNSRQLSSLLKSALTTKVVCQEGGDIVGTKLTNLV